MTPSEVLNAILPYAVMIGIATSALASIALVVRTLTTNAVVKGRRLNSDVLSRLAEIEAAMKRDASRLDAQLASSAKVVQSDPSRSTIAELYDIAHDLQSSAGEVHRLLEDLNDGNIVRTEAGERRRIIDLGKSVLQTESYIKTVLKKIEQQKHASTAAQSPHVTNQG